MKKLTRDEIEKLKKEGINTDKLQKSIKDKKEKYINNKPITK